MWSIQKSLSLCLCLRLWLWLFIRFYCWIYILKWIKKRQQTCREDLKFNTMALKHVTTLYLLVFTCLWMRTHTCNAMHWIGLHCVRVILNWIELNASNATHSSNQTKPNETNAKRSEAKQEDQNENEYIIINKKIDSKKRQSLDRVEKNPKFFKTHLSFFSREFWPCARIMNQIFFLFHTTYGYILCVRTLSSYLLLCICFLSFPHCLLIPYILHSACV